MYAVFACDCYYPGVNNIKFIGSYRDCQEYVENMSNEYDIVEIEEIGRYQK